jgi:Leucine-rich repeat (LRR) protein
MIGQLQHLTNLQLKDCENLKQLPQSITSLFSLSILELSNYKFIQSLLATIGQLQHLTLLCLACENIKEIPQSIASLSSLLFFYLCGYKSIESLPTMIGQP